MAWLTFSAEKDKHMNTEKYTIKRFGNVCGSPWPTQTASTALHAGQTAQQLSNESGGYFYVIDDENVVVFISEHRHPAPRSLNDRRFVRPNSIVLTLLERETPPGGLRPQPIPVLRRLPLT